MIEKVKSAPHAEVSGEPIAPAKEPKEPSVLEISLLFAVVFALHIVAVCRVGNYWNLAVAWGDNNAYLQIAATIRQWRAASVDMPWHFWGFPYAIAGVGTLFSIPLLKALLLISVLASLGVSLLVHRLYGGWVALAFVFFINYQWFITSLEGGSESLFVCLLLGSFLAARSARWNVAALLAALSTTVRPVGIFALVCFAVMLCWRREYRKMAVVTLIGLAIGVLYVIPVWSILGSPFANISGYRAVTGGWSSHGWPVTYPFGALITDYIGGLRNLRWPNFPLPIIWLTLALTGAAAMWLPRNRRSFSTVNQPEALFASAYLAFLLVFNANDYIASCLPRYLIPALPMFLFALRDWIPHSRRLLWGGAVLSALLSAAAIVGFKSVFGFRLP